MDADEKDPRPRQSRPDKSLRERALAHLARREHSRLQLRRRLAPFAESTEEIERLLDQLQAENLLSDQRFADVIARARGPRFGALRLAQELKQHGVGAETQGPILAQLKQTERARARALWQRKFGRLAADSAERSRQTRFLMQRGFPADLVRRIVEGRDDE